MTEKEIQNRLLSASRFVDCNQYEVMSMKGNQTQKDCPHCRGSRKHSLGSREVEACRVVMANRSDSKSKNNRGGNSGERRHQGPR